MGNEITKQEQLMKFAGCDKCYGENNGKCFLNDRVFCSSWAEAERMYEQGYRILSKEQLELLGEKE